MKALIKLFLILFVVFTSTLLIMKFTGLLTLEQIEGWLSEAKEFSPFYVGGIVVLLLFADLFIAVPTLTVTLLAGYFLGHMYGAMAALLGVTLAGVSGYLLSYRYGDKILDFLIKDKEERNDAINTFNKHGFVMILLSRAMPLLPESTACLSGMTKMPFLKFLTAWLISSVPYIFIVTYAGSVSSLDNPIPAILAAIGISVFFWLAWYFYHRLNKKPL